MLQTSNSTILYLDIEYAFISFPYIANNMCVLEDKAKITGQHHSKIVQLKLKEVESDIQRCHRAETGKSISCLKLHEEF